MKFPVECTPKKCYTIAKEPECTHNNCHDFHSPKMILLRVVAKNRNEERESRCWPVKFLKSFYKMETRFLTHVC